MVVQVVAYTADAAVYCPSCAYEKYTHKQWDGLSNISNGVLDNEGHEVTPIFTWDDFEFNQYCDTCGKLVVLGYYKDQLEYEKED